MEWEEMISLPTSDLNSAAVDSLSFQGDRYPSCKYSSLHHCKKMQEASVDKKLQKLIHVTKTTLPNPLPEPMETYIKAREPSAPNPALRPHTVAAPSGHSVGLARPGQAEMRSCPRHSYASKTATMQCYAYIDHMGSHTYSKNEIRNAKPKC